MKALSLQGNQKRDQMAKAMIREGKPESSAYAIATASAERSEGVRPKKKSAPSRAPRKRRK